MTTSKRALRRTAFAAGMTGLLTAVAACGSASRPSDGSGHLTGSDTTCVATAQLIEIVAPTHANQRRPAQLPDQVTCAITAALHAGRKVGIVTDEGIPRTVLPPTSFPISRANGGAEADDTAQALGAITHLSITQSPVSAGADTTDAIMLAAQEGGPGCVVEVLGSAVDDRGPLAAKRQGLLAGTDPAELASYNVKTGAVTDLRGITVNLFSAGFAAAPQPDLGPSDRSRIATAVTDSFVAAHATVRSFVVPETGTPISSNLATGVVSPPTSVPFTPPVASAPSTTTFVGTSALADFVPDKPSLIDAAAARTQLTSLSQWLNADVRRRAQIAGTVASTTSNTPSADPGSVALSLARANTIRELLVGGLGVSSPQVTVVGLGYLADPPDLTPARLLDPIKANLNRSTRITTWSIPA